MQVSQTHPSVTRVQTRLASIAAKVAKCRAALPVATDVQPETRVPFVQLYPHLRESHLKAQRRLFAAIKDADLSMELSVRLSGINALLGLSLTSSRGLSPDELHVVADAVEAGRFCGLALKSPAKNGLLLIIAP